MKSIAIVTDSNCGMSPAQVKDLASTCFQCRFL